MAMMNILLTAALFSSLGCAARSYHAPRFQAIELRGATVSEERDSRHTSRCHVGNWIYDAGRKMWIGVCK